MGSNLWFPLTARRVRGLRLMHSQEAVPNLIAVWLSCLLIFWNLARAAPPDAVAVNPVALAFYGGLIPVAAFLAERRWLRAPPAPPDGKTDGP